MSLSPEQWEGVLDIGTKLLVMLMVVIAVVGLLSIAAAIVGALHSRIVLRRIQTGPVTGEDLRDVELLSNRTLKKAQGTATGILRDEIVAVQRLRQDRNRWN